MIEKLTGISLQRDKLATGSWRDAVNAPLVQEKLDLARLKARRRMVSLGYSRNR